jgi:hypothetical protein
MVSMVTINFVVSPKTRQQYVPYTCTFPILPAYGEE